MRSSTAPHLGKIGRLLQRSYVEPGKKGQMICGPPWWWTIKPPGVKGTIAVCEKDLQLINALDRLARS